MKKADAKRAGELAIKIDDIEYEIAWLRTRRDLVNIKFADEDNLTMFVTRASNDLKPYILVALEEVLNRTVKELEDL